MPSETERQRRFMGAELARERAGKKTRTGMSETQLSEFAGSVRKSKNPGRHGGYEMGKAGHKTHRPAPAGAKSAMYGGPPHEGFHRVDAGVGPQGAAVARENPHKHLGRFSTGRPRKVTGRSTAVKPGANR